MKNTNRFVFPVVHHLSYKTSVEQAELAFSLGADGVFLISHHGQDDALLAPARAIKAANKDKLVGLNLLGSKASVALGVACEIGLDMVWSDCPGVTSYGGNSEAEEIQSILKENPGVTFFGSVAFKYQPVDPNPGLAAKIASRYGMLPTTSGSGTGYAPLVDKAVLMSKAVEGGCLAVASGMTPENVCEFLPYFTHYLVATGVSIDAYRFDKVRLGEFIRIAKSFNGGRCDA